MRHHLFLTLIGAILSLCFLSQIDAQTTPTEQSKLDSSHSASGAIGNKAPLSHENAPRTLHQDATSTMEGSEVQSPQFTQTLDQTLPVTYKEKDVFNFYFSNAHRKESELKVKQFNSLMSKGIELVSDRPHARVVLTPQKRFHLFVHDQFVGDFSPYELEPKTESFEQTRANFEGQVQQFVETVIERRIWQARARKFFLSFFIIVAGLIVFSQLRQLFDRLESKFQERKASIHPISFMSETVITSDTLSSFMTLGLVVGRFMTYSFIFLGALFGVFSQFEPLQEIGPQILESLYRKVGWGARSTIQKIPGLVLAVLLIVLLQIILRFLSLLSKNFTAGRLRLKGIDSHRLPVVRYLGTVFALLLLVPLIIGSLYGDFMSPTQVIFLIFVSALALGLVPLFSQFAIGCYCLWTGDLKEGQWVRISSEPLEVIRTSLTHVTVVPLKGGILRIPFHKFLFHSYEVLHSAPGQIWRAQFELSQGHSAEELLSLINSSEKVSTTLQTEHFKKVTLSVVNIENSLVTVEWQDDKSLSYLDHYKLLSEICSPALWIKFNGLKTISFSENP